MDSIRSLFYILCMGLFLTVNCQQQQPLVSSNVISLDTVFTVYCDASRVALPSTAITDIRKLTINRMTATDTTETTMVQFRALTAPNEKPYYFPNPQNRNWNISYTGANQGANNKLTMKLVWNLNDARCDDGGLYSCTVDYIVTSGSNSGSVEESTDISQNVTADVGTSGFDLTVVTNDVDNDQKYSKGDNITFTCKVTGPSTLAFKWEAMTMDGNGNEITQQLEVVTPTPGPSSGTGYCMTYSMVSTLNIQEEDISTETTYICSVLFKNQIVERSNITIGEGQVQPPGGIRGTTPRNGSSIVMCDVMRITWALMLMCLLRWQFEQTRD